MVTADLTLICAALYEGKSQSRHQFDPHRGGTQVFKVKNRILRTYKVFYAQHHSYIELKYCWKKDLKMKFKYKS